jgi:hypothetical protein
MDEKELTLYIDIIDKQWHGLELSNIKAEQYNDKVLVTFEYEHGKGMYLFKVESKIRILCYEYMKLGG